MSAYVVDDRTIDYIVSWIECRRAERLHTSAIPAWTNVENVPMHLFSAVGTFEDGTRYLQLDRMSPDDIGQMLLDENVRSVNYRYRERNTAPCYRFRAVPSHLLRPAWVVKSCDCLRYQSCETPDWKQTAAYAVLDAIRESAIHTLTKDAPWGVTDADLDHADRVR